MGNQPGNRRNGTDEWVHVTVNGEEIVCTNEHPFYSPVKGWTAACQLRAGDILVGLQHCGHWGIKLSRYG